MTSKRKRGRKPGKCSDKKTYAQCYYAKHCDWDKELKKCVDKSPPRVSPRRVSVADINDVLGGLTLESKSDDEKSYSSSPTRYTHRVPEEFGLSPYQNISLPT